MSDPKKVEPVKQTEAQLHDAELIKATVKAVTEEMIPAMLAMQMTGGKAQDQSLHTKLAVDQDLQYRRTSKCQVCGQRVSGCLGEHESIVVYPTRFMQYADYFQGVFINGERYLSNNADHRIPVPKNAVGDILHKIRVAEEEEATARNGRVKHHNSGDVSAPRPVNAAADGFR